MRIGLGRSEKIFPAHLFFREDCPFLIMSEKIFLSGHSREVRNIINALGLEGFGVLSVQLTISAGEVVRVTADVYPTAEQLIALGGEIEKFKELATIASVEFIYEDKEGDTIENCRLKEKLKKIRRG